MVKFSVLAAEDNSTRQKHNQALEEIRSATNVVHGGIILGTYFRYWIIALS